MPSFAETVTVQYDPKSYGRNRSAIRQLNRELKVTPQPMKTLHRRLIQHIAPIGKG
jgi:hypothetical protein